jgi:DNA-binding MarR family transcriptional regulator
VNLENAIKSTTFQSNRQKAGLNILYTSWWLKTVVAVELKKYGITNEQYNVMRVLKGKHPNQMCIRDIASRMIEKSSNVPRIMDRLEVKKMIKRSTSALDKRETVVNLTDVGLHILELATIDINKVFDKVIVISEEKAKQLNELLEMYREKE